jgi:hypothetical protein
MPEEILISSAYFPPTVCFSLASATEKVVVEKWENYHKQTYRNRCIILGANGPILLIVPVVRGSFHKTAISELLVDDTLKWRTAHIRGIISAYAMAPYFEYYFDIIEDAINKKCRFLIDYNFYITEQICNCIGLSVPFVFSSEFTPLNSKKNDFRYSISPKIKDPVSGYSEKPFTQVFSDKFGFIPGLSIIDTLLNNGPGTLALIRESLVY